MCGLFAYFDPSFTTALPFEPRRVLAALKSRGPDGFGVLHLPNCSLLHTRLAILDPENGHQPMVHEQSGAAITYNGEVYNAPDLRENLVKRGHKFRTSTDTEVVLAAYVEYGEGCVAMFEGMFAFAIWDPREQYIFAARDRLGEKPLYFARLPGGAVMVASEIKALLAAGLEPTINADAVDHYLQWKYTPVDIPIYNEIETVPPAHSMLFRSTTATYRNYWQLPPVNTNSINAAHAVDELHHLLLVAVSRRLQSDRDVGIFLSGGIDSAILAALAARQSDRPLESFTIAYGAGLDESPRATMLASTLGITSTIVPVRSFSPEDLEKVCSYFDQPHADSANLSQALLTSCASEKVQVIMSGDGADELFCGYRWYGQSPSLENRQNQMTIFPTNLRQKLFPVLVEPEPFATSADPFDAMNSMDISHYLGGQLLPKADMIGMSYGVELRAPFLDFRIVEFARSLPTDIKIGDENKPLLRNLFQRILPNLSLPDKKQGFGPPLPEYLKAPQFREYVFDRLGKAARIREFLDGRELDKQIQPLGKNLDRQSAYRIWVLLCLELWLDKAEIV